VWRAFTLTERPAQRILSISGWLSSSVFYSVPSCQGGPSWWQQCGSNRHQNTIERTRTPSPAKAGFSAYLSHMPGRDRTHPDVLIRIVAPKVAGSSPVGHPLICR
jgi:hypothetical protein